MPDKIRISNRTNWKSPYGQRLISAIPVLTTLVLLISAGCGGSSRSTDQGVKAELVSIRPMAGNDKKVKIVVKVTNVSGKEIVRAKANVTILDADGKSLGSKSTYLIHGGKGGLAPGKSIEEDTFIEVSDNTRGKDFSFEIESVRFKE